MNNEFMKRAIELSIQSVKNGGGPFGAVIVKDDKIIEGDPDSIKTVKDEWKFSKNMWSQNPTWYLIETANN